MIAKLSIWCGMLLHGVLATYFVVAARKMLRTFSTIVDQGTGDAHELSHGVGDALDLASQGFAFGWLGLALLLGGIFLGKIKRTWAFRCAIVTASIWILAFPSGTIVGLIVIGIMVATRKQFTRDRSPRTPIETGGTGNSVTLSRDA